METFKYSSFKKLLKKQGLEKTYNIINFSKLYYFLLEQDITQFDFQIKTIEGPFTSRRQMKIISCFKKLT